MLLGISGSLRAGSVNRKLVREAARLYGGPYEEADLRLPLYDGDLEQAEGIPVAVQRLADQIAAAEAVVISTPEYNQSLSGVLKNALDWISRVEGNPWLHKPVAIMSATAGRAGGARGSYALRLAMLPFRPRMVAGPDIGVAGAAKEFDANGQLTGELYLKNLGELMDQVKAEAAR
ncbi:MAG: NAD(P)H-dependent oxidoreductase [Pseudomonadota bacterium]